MQYKVMGRTRTGFTEAYALSLSVNYDLDLLPIEVVLARDTSSKETQSLTDSSV